MIYRWDYFGKKRWFDTNRTTFFVEETSNCSDIFRIKISNVSGNYDYYSIGYKRFVKGNLSKYVFYKLYHSLSDAFNNWEDEDKYDIQPRFKISIKRFLKQIIYSPLEKNER